MSEALPADVKSWLRDVEQRVAALDVPAALYAQAGDVAGALARTSRRLEEGPLAPLRVAFFGPTGAGKSKLFNSLGGADVSPSHFRRPCTRAAVSLVHEDHSAYADALGGEWRSHRDPRWREALFVDTPDFDSVEAANRVEAERVWNESDAIVLVADVNKYGDQSTWEYVGRLISARRPFIVVLNKVVGKAPVTDFFARLDAALPESESSLDEFDGRRRVVVREHPIADADLIPESDPGLGELIRETEALIGSDSRRRAWLAARLRTDVELAAARWNETSAGLRAYLDAHERLAGELEKIFADESERLRRTLETDLDSSVKKQVFARVLSEIERIDLLRYPRKLLALPIEGIKTIYRRFFPADPAIDSASAARVDTSGARPTVEARALAMVERASVALQREAAVAGVVAVRGAGDAAASAVPSLGHDETAELVESRENEFREWLRAEVEDTAAKLTGENKLKFILAQVLYNGVVVGVQIHTAGGLMVSEVVTDAVLSPLVAKAVGLAVSSEQVSAFEKRARDERYRRLVEVLETLYRRQIEALTPPVAWREEFEALDAELERLGRGADGIVDRFLQVPSGTER